jgi:hypothetical protein
LYQYQIYENRVSADYNSKKMLVQNLQKLGLCRLLLQKILLHKICENLIASSQQTKVRNRAFADYNSKNLRKLFLAESDFCCKFCSNISAMSTATLPWGTGFESSF